MQKDDQKLEDKSTFAHFFGKMHFRIAQKCRSQTVSWLIAKIATHLVGSLSQHEMIEIQ